MYHKIPGLRMHHLRDVYHLRHSTACEGLRWELICSWPMLFLEVSSLLAVTHGANMTYDLYKRTHKHTFASTWRCKENKLDISSPVLVDMFLFSDSSATDR